MTPGPVQPATERIIFLNNPGARQGDKMAELCDELLGNSVEVLTADDDIGAAIDEVMHQPPERLVVAGGDGTVLAAAQRLAHQETALAIIPTGTSNNFARTLGISTELPEACQLATHGSVRSIDLGCVDGIHFVNAVTIGISSTIAEETPPMLKRILGPASYGVTGLRVLSDAEPFTIRFTHDGGTASTRTHQAIVANGRYIGEGEAAPQARADDGLLDVTVLGDETRRHLVGAWVDLRDGRHTERPDSLHMAVPAVRVETEPPQTLDIDGELAHETPAHLWVDRKALRVVVPSPPTRPS